jgi:hypothetical protein
MARCSLLRCGLARWCRRASNIGKDEIRATVLFPQRATTKEFQRYEQSTIPISNLVDSRGADYP